MVTLSKVGREKKTNLERGLLVCYTGWWGAIHSRLKDGRSKGSEALNGDVCSENHT